MEISKVLKEVIKLETNATDEEYSRAAHLFVIDKFIELLNEEKKQWQGYELGKFGDLEDTHTALLLENLTNLYDDEWFVGIEDLIDKHCAALYAKYSEEEVDKWFE